MNSDFIKDIAEKIQVNLNDFLKSDSSLKEIKKKYKLETHLNTYYRPKPTIHLRATFILRNNNLTFEINDYLSLKLEQNNINIYIAGKKINQCKHLFLNFEKEELSEYNSFDSIDEIKEFYNKKRGDHQHYNTDIDIEAEFWGHCSNLQAWYENEYDTRLLDMNLAFPLLKKLTDAGDLKAKKVFKEEIAKRIESNYPNVVRFLLNGSYLYHFNLEELKLIKEKLDPNKLGEEIIQEFDKEFSLILRGGEIAKFYLEYNTRHFGFKIAYKENIYFLTYFRGNVKIMTNETFKKAYNIQPYNQVLLEESLLSPTSLTFNKKEFYERSLLNQVSKIIGPSTIYSMIDFPLILIGSKFTGSIAPIYNVDRVYHRYIISRLIPYIENKEIGKNFTKKELIEKIMKLNPKQWYLTNVKKDDLIHDYYNLNKDKEKRV